MQPSGTTFIATDMNHNTVNSRSKHLPGTKTFASSIDEAVNRDLGNYYHSCDTAEFLERILPVSESCVETILKALTRKSLYKDGRWAKMPASNESKEDEFYGPFIEIANAISYEATTAGMEAEGHVNGVWVDRHRTSPEEDAAKICPDCLYVSSSAAIQEAERTAQARDELHQPGVSAKDEKKARSLIGKTEKRRVKERTKLSVWWRQVHTPVEIKPDEKHWEKAYTQICCYMRQVLAEQLDRRFVVGLLLCRDQLTVLLSDRSGILGTSTTIDIHKDPKQFIQVIASFCILEAHQIGWDTTMEVYNPGRPYRNPSCQEILPSEGDRYSLLGSHNDRLYAYEDIAIHDGKHDSTLDWIREDINYTAHEDNSQKTGSKRIREEDDNDAESYFHITIASSSHAKHFVPSSDPTDLVSRVHTQLIMSHSGWAIRHFKSLLELLQVILDGVRDHHIFYKNGGVHRDVSAGNIIIVATNDGNETKGRLIDFDHAKVTKEFAAMKLSEVTDESLVELWRAAISCTPEMRLYTLDKDVIIKALQVVHLHDILPYISGVLAVRQRFFNFRSSGNLASADLHWDMADIRRPQFADHEARSDNRTGTLPYMSAEVMSTNFLFLPQPEDGVFFHDAAHDMESFFWVVMNICLTRKGPGANMTRDELHPSRDKDDRDIALEDLLWDLFNSDKNNLLKKKRELLAQPELMNDILDKFHPYFNELKPLVLQWWHTLVLAYRFRAYEYLDIHNHIIDILEETITRVKQFKENPEDLEATQREIDRREMHRNATLKMFVPKDPLKTPPPTATMSSNVSPDGIWTSQTQRATKRSRK